ncbi:hypothetical protein C3L33_03822, partial [Rhododendron williamsianum]
MREKPQFSIVFKWEKLSPQSQTCELISLYMLDAAIGFNVETVQYNNIKFQVWDLAYSLASQASSSERQDSAPERGPSRNIARWADKYQEEELKGAVVLIYANKQDLLGALDDATVTEALELHKIKNRQWSIFKTSAIKGEGLFEGLDWLSNTLKSGGG